MSFDEPLWLLVLLCLPLIIGLYFYSMLRRRSRYNMRFTNVNLLANVVAEQPRWRRHVPAAFFLAALALLAIAAARPHAERQIPVEEATVMLVVDVSGSMNATDVAPTRMEAAKQASHVFLDVVPEDFRVGVISFEANVRLEHPPDRDRDAAATAVDRLQAEGGTAIGDALMFALSVLDDPERHGGEPVPPDGENGAGAAGEGDEAPGAVLFMTDGYNTAGVADPMEAGRVAASRGVPVYTVAFGTEDGVVDVFDSEGRLRRVPVPPDEETMRQIADVTGAETFTAVTGEELSSVYEDVGTRIGSDVERHEVTWAFAASALLILLAGGSLSLFWFNRFP